MCTVAATTCRLVLRFIFIGDLFMDEDGYFSMRCVVYMSLFKQSGMVLCIEVQMFLKRRLLDA